MKFPDIRAWPVKFSALAALIAALAFYVERHWGFGLADESYLWYGAQRIVQGEVPLRDFMSYDPARYLLSGAWMWLAGDDGILALRGFLGLLTILATVLASSLVAKAWCLDRWWPIVLVAVLFTLWIVPRNKVFDALASIVLVASIAWVIGRPCVSRFFRLGIIVGLLAILGRNHGVYGLCASLVAGIWTAWQGHLQQRRQTLIAFAAGVGIGYAPMWMAALFIPGFAAAVLQSVRLMFDYGATNIALPVIWPWTALLNGRFDPDSILMGSLFAALPIFDVAGIVVMIYLGRQRRDLSPLFVAAVCASIPYTHYAFSRANISHLSLAVMPMLIGVLAGTSIRPVTPWRAVFLPLSLILLSMPCALWLHPRYEAWRSAEPWREVRIGGDALMLKPQEANAVDLLEALSRTRKDPGPLLVAPLWPGAYTLFHQRSPDWEIYPLVPRSKDFQEAEIARLRRSRIGLAAVLNVPADGNAASLYSNTHPLIFAYLKRCYTQRQPTVTGIPMVIFDGPDRCHRSEVSDGPIPGTTP